MFVLRALSCHSARGGPVATIFAGFAFNVVFFVFFGFFVPSW
jgi:hypothetical protein